MRPKEEKIRRILDDFGRALLGALGGSSKVGETFQRLRGEGYALHLILGCQPERSANGEPAVPAACDDAGVSAESPAPREAPPFHVNAEDVSFLKSIGIDPTRTVRRRRKPRFSV